MDNMDIENDIDNICDLMKQVDIKNNDFSLPFNLVKQLHKTMIIRNFKCGFCNDNLPEVIFIYLTLDIRNKYQLCSTDRLCRHCANVYHSDLKISDASGMFYPTFMIF